MMSNQGSLRSNDQEWTEHTAVKDGLPSEHVSIPITIPLLALSQEGGKVFIIGAKPFKGSRTGGQNVPKRGRMFHMTPLPEKHPRNDTLNVP